MPYSFSKYFHKTLSWIICLAILTLPTFYTLLRPGFFPMQDDIQALRVYEMDKCFKDRQVPCRWVPDMGYGYGYPLFEFYPPLPFYLGQIFHLVGFQFIDSVKILFVLGFVGSTMAMFLLLQAVVGRWPALVGAILYSVVPYKAMEVFVRGALSEFLAFTFFPLIFWAIYQLSKSGKKRYMFWLALSVGGLLITHNLMSFIFLPLVVIWTLLWLYLEKKWRWGYKILIGFLLGVGLSLFFILPLLFERSYVHLDTILSGYFDYRQHFASINQLFLSNHFGYGSSQLGASDDLSLSTGIIQWVMGLAAVVLALTSIRKNKQLSWIVLTLAGAELMILFLMHQRSVFIWEKINLLTWLQFPWRFLSDSVFLLSILGGCAVYFLQLKNKQLAIWLGITVIVCLYILHANFFQPKEWLNISDREKFTGESWQKQLTISIFDYLPIYAKLPPNIEAPSKAEVVEGSAKIIQYYKGSNHQGGQILVFENSTIRLPLFDFPGMVVLANGQILEHGHSDCRGEPYCFGLISFNLNPGDYQIEAKLTDIPVRVLGNILTLLSTVSLLVIWRFKFRWID